MKRKIYETNMVHGLSPDISPIIVDAILMPTGEVICMGKVLFLLDVEKNKGGFCGHVWYIKKEYNQDV